MKKLLISISLVTFLSAGFINPETGWEYQQSTFQGFYMLQSTQVDGAEAESSDVIGAFKDGVCVGWVYVDPSGFTTVPLMGNDGSPAFGGYMSSGDTADLYIFDATHGSILPLDVSDTSVDLDGDLDIVTNGSEFAIWQQDGTPSENEYQKIVRPNIICTDDRGRKRASRNDSCPSRAGGRTRRSTIPSFFRVCHTGPGQS